MELRARPSYNGSSPDALTCDWEYDVWLFWPSTGSLLPLPRVDNEERFEVCVDCCAGFVHLIATALVQRRALEAWKSQSDGTNQRSERVDPLHDVCCISL